MEYNFEGVIFSYNSTKHIRNLMNTHYGSKCSLNVAKLLAAIFNVILIEEINDTTKIIDKVEHMKKLYDVETKDDDDFLEKYLQFMQLIINKEDEQFYKDNVISNAIHGFVQFVQCMSKVLHNMYHNPIRITSNPVTEKNILSYLFNIGFPHFGGIHNGFHASKNYKPSCIAKDSDEEDKSDDPKDDSKEEPDDTTCDKESESDDE